MEMKLWRQKPHLFYKTPSLNKVKTLSFLLVFLLTKVKTFYKDGDETFYGDENSISFTRFPYLLTLFFSSKLQR